jgi:hypothetical protein
MPQRVARSAAVAACAVLALAVAGCSGSDDGVAASGSPSSTPTATPTPTVEIPEVPVPERPADEHTSDGAVAFTKYAVEVINRAYLTGDTASMRAIATPDCGTCDRAAADIDGVYDEGQRFDGGQMTVVRAGGVAIAENVNPTTPTVMDITELWVIRADGSKKSTAPADVGVEILWDLAWNGSWRLAEVRSNT